MVPLTSKFNIIFGASTEEKRRDIDEDLSILLSDHENVDERDDGNNGDDGDDSDMEKSLVDTSIPLTEVS